MIFFTADTHFNHANVIKYCNRPFASVQEMNEELVKRWNDTVSLTDEIYHLGDFALGSYNTTKDILDSLKGRIYLVKGNHDKQIYAERFEWVKDYYELKYQKQLIVLCHYAMRTWRNSHHGSWNLHGHSHGTLEILPNLRQHDVGIDVNDYRPISFDQVQEIMKTKEWEPIDHHDTSTND